MWWNLVLGPVTEVVNKVIDKLVPDVAAASKIKLEMQQELMRQDFSAAMAQIEVNKTEAAHDSVFVAGWRPYIGWVCGSGLAYATIGQPFLAFIVLAVVWMQSPVGTPFPPLPTLDVAQLVTLLLGMLGLGGMRTYEKIKGETTTATKVGA